MKNIHILPTDKPSRLYLTTREYVLDKEYTLSTDECENKHIYITSDKEIKEGNYVTNGEHVSQAINEWWTKFYIGNLNLTADYWKIILTTDQDLIKDGVQAIDDDFLEWFVKNPTCNKVETKLIEEIPSEFTFGMFGNDEPPTELVYKIIIPKEEPKQIKCYDKYNQVLSEGDYVDVQKDGVQIIYKKEDNQLYFKPYGEEDRVCAYFCNDLAKCDEVGNWINNDRYEDIVEESKKETLKEASERLYPKQKYAYSYYGYVELLEQEAFELGAKWQQENSYSEEEVLKAQQAILGNIKDALQDENYIIDYLKQFKK